MQGSYPLDLDVISPPTIERWRPLVNWLLLIPHFLWLGILALAAEVVAVLGWFAILFTGALPEGWGNFLMGVLRYQWRICCYLYGWTTGYPGFSPVAGYVDPGDEPAILYCARPTTRNRLTVLVRAILAVPHYVVLYFVRIAAGAVLFVAWFAVVATGRWPDGMRRFVIGYFRWDLRVEGYQLLVTDEYPPFSLLP